MFDNSKKITLIFRNQFFKKIAKKTKNKQIDDENETKKFSFEQVQISKISFDFIHSHNEKLKNRAYRKKKKKTFEKIEKKKIFSKKISAIIKSITLRFLYNNLRLMNVLNKNVCSKSQKFERKNFNNF